MSSSCQALLSQLKDCLLHSDCVLKQEHLPSECLKEHLIELPEECQNLRKATFECKRNMVCSNNYTKGNWNIQISAAGHAEEVQREHSGLEREQDARAAYTIILVPASSQESVTS